MSQALRLYTSHFLSTWNSRLFQFGSVLFLADLYPGTLFPVSFYALLSVLPGALAASRLGHYIDTNNRLKVVRWSIIGQRLAVVAACLLFLYPLPNQGAMLLLLAALGGIENSSNIVNTVSVERDWVVVVAGPNTSFLQSLNSRMRFIDLSCKLMGPFIVGFLDSIDHRSAIIAVLAMSLFSCGLEYFAILLVYKSVPELAVQQAHVEDSDAEAAGAGEMDPINPIGPHDNQGFSFWRHRLMPVSLALTATYITVLAFSGPMITYLLSSGMDVRTITLFRTVSVVVELSATLLTPLVLSRTGPLRAAAGFIDFQWLSLVVTMFFFWQLGTVSAAKALASGVTVSRVGLWGFDLSTQIIIQNGIKESERGKYSTAEKSLQNWAMIIVYLTTMILSRPDQFKWPVLMSVFTVGVAMVMFNYFLFCGKKTNE